MTAFGRWWFAPVPAERLAALRILVGGYALVYLAIRSAHLMSYGDADPALFTPVGVVTVLPRPLLPIVVKALVAVTGLLSVPFFLGYRFRITAPLFAASLLWTLTYSNSFGKILHTDNLLVLQVGILAVTPAADVLSVEAARPKLQRSPGCYGWGIRLMCCVVALAYFLAAVAKLKNSGLAFVDGETLRNYVAFDNVRKAELGSVHSPLGAWLLPYPWLFTGLAWMSLGLELGAPLALAERRVGVAWAVLIWGFHVGVLALMAIAFAFQLSGVAFACFFRVERLVPVLRRLRGRVRRGAPARSPTG